MSGKGIRGRKVGTIMPAPAFPPLQGADGNHQCDKRVVIAAVNTEIMKAVHGAGEALRITHHADEGIHQGADFIQVFAPLRYAW